MQGFKDKFYGCFFGSIVGDALGMPYEFKAPEDIAYQPNMQEGGPFRLPKGAWTDDTSMMLCLADSLIESKGFNPQNQLFKYLRWYEEGYNSSVGHCFDIGYQTMQALENFNKDYYKVVAVEEKTKSGNGALMRIAPIPLVFSNLSDVLKYAEESTITTHNNYLCVHYSQLYCNAIRDQLLSYDKIVIPSESYGQCLGFVQDSYNLAIDAFNSTTSFADCMEYVIRKGGDTDTNAAIAGMLAGSYYGLQSIPSSWIKDLLKVSKLFKTCDSLFELRLLIDDNKL